MAATNDKGETFGEWLLRRPRRGDATDALVAVARADPRFPRHGSTDDVRKRFNEIRSDDDMHPAIDNAKVDWMWG